MNSKCKIYSEYNPVTWTIHKNNIENTLLNNSTGKSGHGLLFLNVESAGEIEFSDSMCSINNKNEKICHKQLNRGLKYKNGNMDSVHTPLSVVNFHTHPLNCYLEAQTIWGWPSGEDLAQCLNFAEDNNLVHIIFAIEGTYVIDVNKILLNYLKTKPTLYNNLKYNIEQLFKLTHKHRMMVNESNPKISLEHEFKQIFIKPLSDKKMLNIGNQEHILYLWLILVNSLTINSVKILTKQFNNYFEFKNISNFNDEKYNRMKIFNINFFPNNTIQWNPNLKKKRII